MHDVRMHGFICTLVSVASLDQKSFSLRMFASSSASLAAVAALAFALLQGKVEVPSYTGTVGLGGFNHGWQMEHPQSEPISVETCSCHCVCPAAKCSITAAVFGGDDEGRMELVVVALLLALVWSCGWCYGSRCGHSRERDAPLRAGGRQLALAGDDGALASRGLIVRRR